MTNKDAIKHLSHKISYYKAIDENWADSVSIDALEIAVRAMAKEREKGEWIEVQRYRPTDKRAINECSICHDTIWMYDGDRRWNYCPRCGADMRGDGNEKIK